MFTLLLQVGVGLKKYMNDLKNNLPEVSSVSNVGVWVYNSKSKSYELAPQWPENVTFTDGVRLRRSMAAGSHWVDKLYGRFTSADGRRVEMSLCKWHGVPPPDGKIIALECLEKDFRRCVEKAIQMLAKVKDDTNNRPLSVDDRARTEREFITAQRLKRYRNSSGRRREVRLDDVMERFLEKLGGRWSCSEKQAEHYRRVIQGFTDFAMARHNKNFFLAEVPPEDVTGYLGKEDISPNTYNKRLIVLRRLFRELAPYSETADFLSREHKKEEENVMHEPYSETEIAAILEMAAQIDGLIRSMVIIAVCTGLRLKDICFLQWDSVDTDFTKESPLIRLTTHKTKGDATLGMWPMLKTELARLWKFKKPDAVYVLPEAAEIYSRNEKLLSSRLEKVLSLLGYGDEGRDARRISLNTESEMDRDALMTQVETVLATSDNCPEGRRRSILNVLDLYLRGNSLPKIAEDCGLSKGTVSNYLHLVEKLTARVIIRQRVMPVVIQGDKPKPLKIKPKRAGSRQVSVRKWHSFRTTFIVEALRVGVKMEVLQKVLGSHQVEVIYRHYMRINPDFMRESFTSKVPGYALNRGTDSPVLSDGIAPRMVNATPVKDRLRLALSLAKSLTPTNAVEVRTELLRILED